jgi:predicted HTH domain antitoxin
MAQVLSTDRTSSTRGIKGNVADNGSDGMNSPPGQHKASFNAGTPGADGMNEAQLHKGDENAASISNGDISPHFSPWREETVDQSNERTPAASLEGTKTRKRARDLDYSLDQLSNMTYEQLQTEPFDHDPTAPAPTLPQEVAKGTLAQTLDYMLALKEHKTKASQRSAIFASLPIEQYEDCGDLIVEKFAATIVKFKNARRQRRKAVQEFEDEVARREEKVRGKTSAVEKDLSRLKRGGEEVVRGKGPSS